MEFEKVIINDVKKVLTNSKPYFYNGTLFVDDTTAREAIKVKRVLKKNYDGLLILSFYGNTAAYDFC